jgi:hypothetical protein
VRDDEEDGGGKPESDALEPISEKQPDVEPNDEGETEDGAVETAVQSSADLEGAHLPEEEEKKRGSAAGERGAAESIKKNEARNAYGGRHSAVTTSAPENSAGGKDERSGVPSALKRTRQGKRTGPAA